MIMEFMHAYELLDPFCLSVGRATEDETRI